MSRHDSQVRADFARSYMQRNPRATQVEIRAAVSKEFGRGVSTHTIGTIKRELGIGFTRQRYNEGPRRKAVVARIPQERNQEKAEEAMEIKVVERPRNAQPPEEAIRAAVQLLMAEVPNLRSLRLEVDDEGNPSVEFEVAAIRTGKMTL